MAVALASRYAHEYRRQQIEGARPTELILLLYDGAIRRLSLGLSLLKEGPIEERHQHLVQAQRIVGGLADTLDMQRGGAVAANLQKIYRYMIERIALANMQDQSEPIEEVIGLLRELRESWEQLDAQEREKLSAGASQDGC